MRLKLYKGSASVVGRSSPQSLYSQSHVTFEEDAGAYDQKDAAGFIKINALRLRLLGMRDRRADELTDGGRVAVLTPETAMRGTRRDEFVAALAATAAVFAAVPAMAVTFDFCVHQRALRQRPGRRNGQQPRQQCHRPRRR